MKAHQITSAQPGGTTLRPYKLTGAADPSVFPLMGAEFIVAGGVAVLAAGLAARMAAAIQIMKITTVAQP